MIKLMGLVISGDFTKDKIPFWTELHVIPHLGRYYVPNMKRREQPWGSFLIVHFAKIGCLLTYFSACQCTSGMDNHAITKNGFLALL